MAASRSPEGAVVQVVDDGTGEALAGVELVRPSDAENAVATSNEDGLIAVPSAWVDGTPLFVRLESYSTERVSAGKERLEGSIVVRMSRSATIRGRLVAGNDAPPFAELTVLAWPSSERSPTKRTRRELLEDPVLRWTRCRPDGSFELEGIHRGRSHRLVAGGGGWATASMRSDVRAGNTDVELRVARLYGAMVRLTEVSGERLRLDDGLTGRGFGTLRRPKDGTRATAVPWFLPQVGLNAALDTAIVEARSDMHSRLSFVCKQPDRGSAAVEAIDRELDLGLPGYAAMLVPVRCDWIATHLRVSTIALKRVALLGTIEFEVPAEAGGLELDGGRRPVLRLKPRTGGSEFGFLLDRAERGADGFRFDGVPVGEYEVGLEFDWGSEVIPVESSSGVGAIDVRESGISRAWIAEQDFGTIVFELPGERQAYSGRIRVRIRSSRGGAARDLDLLGPPFHIIGVVPGEVTVEVLVPSAVRSEGEVTVRVEGGEVARVSFGR